MTYSVNLPTTGKANPAATPEAAKAYARARGAKRLGDVDQFVDTIWERSERMGLRPEVAFGQWANETGVGTSDYWIKNLNPGGLRITYPGEPSKTWANGTVAALGMLHRLSLYVYGTAPESILDGAKHDPLPEKVGEAGYLGVAKKLNDLSGRWATDKEYGRKVRDHLNASFHNGGDEGGTNVAETPLTYGKVPHPAFQNRQIWKTEGVGMNNLGKRTVKGASWHRILGSLWGTDGFFRDPSVAALTDYGVGVLAEDGAAHDGEILRWNDPLGYQSGWASGTYSAAHAYGDGAAFVNKYGIDAINRDRVSIEISGFQNTALSQKAKESIAAITAYWADQYHVPWNTFPQVPWDGFSFVTWHEEFGPDLGQKKCPFDAVKNATDEMIDMTKAILKQYQEQPVTDTPPPPSGEYAEPVTYTWLAQPDGKVHMIGDTRILPVHLTYTALRKTPRLQKGSMDSKRVGPDIEKGLRFGSDYAFRADDNLTYVLTKYGTRVRASYLDPKVQITDRGTVSIRYRNKPGEVIVDSSNREDKP